jgi:hypothetical protein
MRILLDYVRRWVRTIAVLAYNVSDSWVAVGLAVLCTSVLRINRFSSCSPSWYRVALTNVRASFRAWYVRMFSLRMTYGLGTECFNGLKYSHMNTSEYRSIRYWIPLRLSVLSTEYLNVLKYSTLNTSTVWSIRYWIRTSTVRAIWNWMSWWVWVSKLRTSTCWTAFKLSLWGSYVRTYLSVFFVLNTFVVCGVRFRALV